MKDLSVHCSFSVKESFGRLGRSHIAQYDGSQTRIEGERRAREAQYSRKWCEGQQERAYNDAKS